MYLRFYCQNEIDTFRKNVVLDFVTFDLLKNNVINNKSIVIFVNTILKRSVIGRFF